MADATQSLRSPALDPTLFRFSGRLLRIATPANQYDEVAIPEQMIAAAQGLRPQVDLFSFSQKLPNIIPLHPYWYEWDNVAAIPLTTFDHWWNAQVDKKVRKHVRRAAKAGVVIRDVEFSDDLVRGIMRIYNEVPVRGGRPFRHYGDDFATCKRKHETYRERSQFIGAYLGDDLIGFVKMVFTEHFARTVQNISMIQHGTLAPGNALLARAVEICTAHGLPYLVYGKMEYDNKGAAGFEEYKRANGFEMMRVPRYFVPLSALGKAALAFRLHRGIDAWIPKVFFARLRALRSRYYASRLRSPAPADVKSA